MKLTHAFLAACLIATAAPAMANHRRAPVDPAGTCSPGDRNVRQGVCERRGTEGTYCGFHPLLQGLMAAYNSALGPWGGVLGGCSL
jgi:hypothetical protein